MELLQPKPQVTPKDFFLQLGIIASLYVSVISLLSLLFQTINYAFPDMLAYYGDPYSTGIRAAIACLIIIFPLFLILSMLAERTFVVSPEKRDLGIRRWLSYFTLFIAGAVVIVDLIMLINSFLGGEITTRFALKTISVLVVTVGVFGYYLSDLNRTPTATSRNKIWAISAVLLVLASVVWGFAIMGSPSVARDRKFDARRVGDLQGIQWQIVNYWQLKEVLPAKIADIEDSISGYRVPVDPETRQSGYEYELGTDGLTFKLCSTFSRSNVGETENSAGRGAYEGGLSAPISSLDKGGKVESWEHEKGRFCFERKIDPEKYPVRKTPVTPFD